MKQYLFPASVTLLALLSAQAEAQVTTIPAQANPGLLAPAPFNEKGVNTQTVKPKKIDEVELNVPEIETAIQPDAVHFLVKSIRVEGNTLFSDQKIRAITSQAEGKELSLNELGKIAKAIQHLYTEQGYLTAHAYIAPQDVNDGQIIISVQEGRLGKLSIVGNHYYHSNVLIGHIEEHPGEPFNIPKMEDNLNRINRFQDVRMKAILSAGANPGETDVRLEVKEPQPWQITGTTDNQGRPLVGMYHYGAEVTNNNLTGVGDQLSLRWIGAKGTQVGSSSYLVPINRHGTMVGGNFSYSHVNVNLGIPHQPLITGNAFNYGALISQPLDKNHVWTVDTGANIRRILSYFDKNQTAATRITSFQVGLNYDKYDRFGRTIARFQTSLAPRGFLESNTSFWKNENYLTRLVTLPKQNLLILKAYSQFTPDALPTAEQFQIGGANSVRGFTEGLMIGDRGYSFSIEDRYPIPYLDKLSPWLSQRVQGVAFFDMGEVWQDRSNSSFRGGFSNQAKHNLLMGAGVGLRAQLTRFMTGFVDFGIPLVTRTPIATSSQPSVRVHFGIRSDFLPQDYRLRSDRSTEVKPKRLNKSQKMAIGQKTP